MLANLLFGDRQIAHRAASLENWTGGLDNLPDEIWDAMVGDSGPSDAGIRVTTKSALANDAWWRCINMVSGDLADTPRHVYTRLPGGGKKRDSSHPADRLIRRKASPDIKAYDFFRTLQGHAMSAGNAYAFIARRGDESPAELWPLSPVVTYPIRANGVLQYITSAGSESWRIDPWDIIHIKGLGFDGLVGYNVVDYARHALGLADAQRKHASYYFSQGANPSILVTHPSDIGETARQNIAKGLQKLYGGIDKHHRVAVIDQGMAATTLAVDARKSQLIEGQHFSRTTIANFLGIPASYVGEQDSVSYNSLEMKRREYLDQALNHWFCQWEEELTDKLLTEPQKQRDTHFIEFVREAIVSVDFGTKVKGAVEQLNNGLLNQDEVREIFNRPAIPGGDGKKFRRPANILIDGEEPQPVPVPALPAAAPAAMEGGGEDARRQALRKIAVTTFRRIGRRFAERARRATGDRAKFESRVLGMDWAEEANAELTESLFPILELAQNPMAAAEVAVRFISRWQPRLRIAATCDDAELPEKVEAALVYLESELPEEMADEILKGN